LKKKIASTFVQKGCTLRDKYRERTPALRTVLDIETPKAPPYSVLRTLLGMCNSVKHYSDLVERYPACLIINSQEGDSILHRVIIDGGYRAKETINSIICTAAKMSYADVDVAERREEATKNLMFGGLTRKDSRGITPLTLLFGLVAYHATRNPYHERWIWLTTLIRRVVHIQSYYCNESQSTKNAFDETLFLSDYSSKELEKTPLLHAALEIGCPMGLMNRILCACGARTAEFCRLDGQNRTPLTIALSNKETPAEIVIELFKRSPAEVIEKLDADEEGLPLHRIINAGIKYSSRSENELVLIGTIVEKAPQVLHFQDNIHGMPPFMLACIDNVWSIDVVYGLLRTGPWAIEPYIKKRKPIK